MSYLKYLFHRMLKGSANIMRHCYWRLFGKKFDNPKEIPIIINNFNRLEYLKKLIGSLEQRGYKKIYIIDNKSTYAPLLKYYDDECPYKVFRLKENGTYLSLWKNRWIFNQFKSSYYVYTDSDLEIDKKCPDDFMERFLEIMKSYPSAQKVGFGLHIDDLPDSYDKKYEVIDWERKWWKYEVEKDVYRAQIDTTFALYRPYAKGKANPYELTLRTGGPYMMHHLPWYVDSKKPTDEEKEYQRIVSEANQQMGHWYMGKP